jgi:hypothetical protein
LPTAEEFDHLRRRGIDEWFAAYQNWPAVELDPSLLPARMQLLDAISVYTNYSPAANMSKLGAIPFVEKI